MPNARDEQIYREAIIQHNPHARDLQIFRECVVSLAPSISSISPTTGTTAGGTAVTINGTNFVTGSTVMFGVNAATSVVVVSGIKITCVAPAGVLGAVTVFVQNSLGLCSAVNAYSYVAIPTILAVTPNDGPTAGGTAVTIVGTNFMSGATVKFGTNSATSVVVLSSALISCVAPAGTGTVNVSVTTAGTTVTDSSAFTYAGAPTLLTVSPSSGPVAGGTAVTLTGTNFFAGSQVFFGTTLASTIVVVSATSITCLSPSGTGTVNVKVTTVGGSVTKTNGYSYVTSLILYSTAPGTTANYIKYLFDSPVKDDKDGDAITLDFTLANTDASFVQLRRGNYVIFGTNTYPIWFTGYITNEPEYVYLGEKAGVPHWGFHYQASSDDILLSQNALGILPPFMNMTQGQIIIALANNIAPGLFNTSNVHAGLTLARYVVNPTQKFADVVNAFAKSAVHRFWGSAHNLNFVPYSSIPQALTISGTAQRFTPDDLTVKASTDDPIINDAVVMGNIEPQRYTVEYSVGDGYTGAFPLSASAFGIESVVLLADNFDSGTINTTNWTVYDEPTNYLQISNGYLNCLGGTGDGTYEVHLDSANTISLGGAMRFAHGEFDFVPQTQNNVVTGVICGLWTQAPNSAYAGCVYGIQVQKVTYSPSNSDEGDDVVSQLRFRNFPPTGVDTITSVILSPIVNGIVDTSQSVVVDTNGQAGNPAPYNILSTYNVGQCCTYEGQYYECVLTTAPGILPTDPGGYFAIATAKRYVIRTLVSNPVTLPHPMHYHYLKSDGTVVSLAPGATAPQVIQFHTYITELDPNTGLITEGFPILWTNNLSPSIEQLFATYILVASDQLQCTVTGVTISTPMQCTLGIQTWGNEGNGGFANKLVGPNEIDATDGLAPYATIAQSGGQNAKSSVLGTPTYNLGTPTLTFFKDTAALQATTPQEGDVIQCSYRSAGAAIGRARDNTSVATEQANWGDSGVRTSVRMGDLTPLPTTSQDCETAAAAIIGQNSYTHYEGAYTVPSQNVTAEPAAGMILPFTNLPSDFPVSSFTEPVNEVSTTLVGLSGSQEFFSHVITYGLKGNSNRLNAVLSQFTQQTDVFTTTDTTQTPAYIPVTGIGLAFASDITNHIMDPTNGGAHGTWEAGQTYTGSVTLLDRNGNLQTLMAANFLDGGTSLADWTASTGCSVDGLIGNAPPSFQIPAGEFMYTNAGVVAGCTIQFDCYFATNTSIDVRIGNNVSGDGAFLRIDTRTGFNSGFGNVVGWTLSGPPTSGVSTPVISPITWTTIKIVISSDGTTATWYLNGTAQTTGTITLIDGPYLGFTDFVGTLHIDNLSTVGGSFTSGLIEPVWANVENAIVELGSVITAQWVQVVGDVLTITSPVDVRGQLNIGTVLALGGFASALFLNGLSITVNGIDDVNGTTFTASVIAANYPFTSDVGIGTVTAAGGLPLTTPDGTAVWLLKGHAYGVDANNFYFDMGQLPPGY